MSEPPVPLVEPRDGLPTVIADNRALATTVAAFAAAHGPVGVDAERASGYRYTHRAYLVQLRRAGAGTALIDPLACPDLSGLGAAIADAEWVLHAASQDLPCLADLGMRPTRLFDTELAGRLLGYPRVGLAPLVETVLGLRPREGPRGRGLVDASATRTVDPVRRFRCRAADRAAGRTARATEGGREVGMGRPGVLRA